MRILHYIYDHTLNPWVGGGGAVRARALNERLAARGHEVTIVSGRYPGVQDREENGVQYRFVGTGADNYVLSTFCYAVRAMGHLRRYARGADVVVEDFSPYNPLFSFLWRKDTVLQLHQREGARHLKKYFVLGIPFMALEAWCPRRFQTAIVVSETCKRQFGLPWAHVVPNGFDSSLLDELASDGGYGLFLGRFHIDQKGLDTLARAWGRLEPSRLLMAGGGKDEWRVKDLFGGLGQVEFVGYLRGREKTACMRDCSFMVMPSRYEGQPLTAMEIAALGKPLVVSDIEELRFAVEAGFAVSFRTGDPDDLAEKIRALQQDPSLREDMGRRARTYATGFTWDAMADRYERLLLQVAGGASQ